MMAKTLLLAMAGVLGAGTCAAQSKTLTGYLIDKACSADTLKKGEAAAKAHDVGCALMDDCQASGYGVLTADNKYITLDAAGNKQAVAALRAAKKKTDLRVTVMGEVAGSSMKVKSLKLD